MNLSLPPKLEACLDATFTQENIARNDIQQHEYELRVLLRLLLDELCPRRTVELGTYQGRTAALLSLATSGRTVTLDPTAYATEELREQALAWGGDLHFVLGDALYPADRDRVLETLGGAGTIDFLFVDDGHHYDVHQRELELWRPCVRPGGWIAFHDINPGANRSPDGTQPPECQTTRFWAGLDGNKQEIIATEFNRNYRGKLPNGGIGILRLP